MGIRLALQLRTAKWLILPGLILLLPAGGVAWGSDGWQIRRESLVAELRPAGRQLALELSHAGRENSPASQLQIEIALGSETEMRDVGQATLTMPPNQSLSLLLTGLSWNSPAENSYLLTVDEVRGPNRRLILYRHAVLRPSNDPPPTSSLSLTPPRSRRASTTQPASPEIPLATAPRYENFTPPAPIQLQAQLLSNPGNPTGALLSIDLFAERPLLKANLEISLRNHRASQPVNLERQLNLSFELPENFSEGDAEPTVHYRLLDRDRRPLLEGDLPLSSLMATDQVGLLDLQTDQPSYRAGEQVRVTLLIEGSSRQGLKIDLAVRDEKGQYFHRDQRQTGPGNTDPAPFFIFTLPAVIKGPVTIEYQLLDPQQGRLYDAGQRELIVREEM
ncbi:MAG: hypothetical protein ACK496_02635 [Acidobacteriota bacterium]